MDSREPRRGPQDATATTVTETTTLPVVLPVVLLSLHHSETASGAHVAAEGALCQTHAPANGLDGTSSDYKADVISSF